MATTKAPATARAKASFVVEDDIFRYTSKSGTTIEIDLDIPADVIDAAMQEDKDEKAQFDVVAEWLGGDADALYKTMGGLERTRFIRAFFDAFEKAADLPLGESESSSTP